LDRAFRESALSALREQLKIHVYSLLGAAEIDEVGRLVMPARLPEERFSIPGSGLYAQVLQEDGTVVWRSRSMLGVSVPFAQISTPGVPVFAQGVAGDGTHVFTLGLKVYWEMGGQRALGLSFQTAQGREEFDALLEGFRQSLWAWLGGVALLLLTAQGLILRWGLAPLRGVAFELSEIEAGRRHEIGGHYPRELRLLTDRLNAFLHNRAGMLERYRNGLGDLAHSLKTPLAVLRAALDSPGDARQLRETLREQLERLQKSIDYQFQRAAASGRGALSAPLPLRPVVDKLSQSLQKVYADKRLRIDLEIDDGAAFHGEEGDLMEVLGNLLDNACKWARRRVVIRARRRGRLMLEVEDDGPGIPEALRLQISTRGVRADPAVEGHGIGLAVVREIVQEVYRGDFEIGSGRMGGALVRVSL
jgi:two-component system sensor histidine kinase PhoQ